MKNYSAILFDIDDTLVDFRKSASLSLKECYEIFFKGKVPFERFIEDYSHINHHLWHQVELGTISPSHVGQERFKQLATLYQMDYQPEISRFYEKKLIEHSSWIDGAEKLLQGLKEKQLKIAFVTNGFAHVQRSKFKNLELDRFSDILVISEEVGVAKPHPDIFHQTLGQLEVEPHETLMVGDSLTSDGEGAKKLGIDFCWYNPILAKHPSDWQPHYVINHWDKFPILSQ